MSSQGDPFPGCESGPFLALWAFPAVDKGNACIETDVCILNE